jgi:Fe-Mn family superoxide dismutase
VPTYTLPDLSYDYAALEPHVSGRIMELHHAKHHAAYVKGANEATEALAEARAKGDFSKAAALERALAFHTSGHVLHSLFWRNLAPKAGGRPGGALGAAIDESFGGFDAMKGQMVGAATSLMGSGWAALSFEPVSARLVVTQIHDHQSNVVQGSVPLMVLDAWEHAYYLQYGPDKASFFQAIWNLWSWDDVARRLEASRKIDPALPGSAPARR